MLKIPMDQIELVNKNITRYKMNLEFISSGMVQEADIDDSNRVHHFKFRSRSDSKKFVEYKREDNIGYAKLCDHTQWSKVNVPEQFPRYLSSVVELLKKGELIKIEESDQIFEVNLRVKNLPPIVAPERYYWKILHQIGIENKKILNKCVEISKNLSVTVIIGIGKRDNKIQNVRTKVESTNINSEAFATFNEIDYEIPRLKLEEISSKPTIEHLSSLFRLPSIGGWSTDNHQAWALRSIDLIDGDDSHFPAGNEKYLDIYSDYWGRDKHPIVSGSYWEDQNVLDDFYKNWLGYDPKPDDYQRDYNHFGGHDLGLENQWYFSFRDKTPDPYIGERYYSARDWGFGGNRLEDPTHNMLTFLEAINQYSSYTPEGKRNAYLMLGHVVHLLQDVGQPDHATLTPHPGSSLTEEEAYTQFKVCMIQTIETMVEACLYCFVFCLACAFVTFVVISIVCNPMSGDSSKLGYERLIKDKWNIDRVKDRMAYMKPIEKADFDTYFQDMENFSIGKEAERGLGSPLGLGNLPEGYFGPDWLNIPGIDPQIGPDDYETYLALTDSLVPDIIACTAGFIKYFYDIVNYPPYVERVVVARTIPKQTPVGFAQFIGPSDLIIDNTWEQQFSWDVPKFTACGQLIGRNLAMKTGRRLHAKNHAYIFIIFGPRVVPTQHKNMRYVKLTLRPGQNDSGGVQPFEVTLNVANDDNQGPYYWGEFECPVSSDNQTYTLEIEIDGYDSGPHFISRNPIGDQLCSDPSSVAFVGGAYPTFDLWGYAPGIDRNHVVSIDPPISLRKAFEENGVSSLRQLSDFVPRPQWQDPILMKDLLDNL